MFIDRSSVFRWSVITFVLFLSALFLTVRYLSVKGASTDLPAWSYATEGNVVKIKRGRMVIPDFGWAERNLPSVEQVDDLLIEIRIRPRWIGQIFFSLGAQEAFFSSYTAYRRPSESFSVFLHVQGRRATLSQQRLDRIIGEPFDVPRPLQSLRIRSQQSYFSIERVSIVDNARGVVIAEDDFGPDLTPVNVALYGALLLVILFGALMIDQRLVGRFYRSGDRGTAAADFMAAFLPLMPAYVLLSPQVFNDIAEGLIQACVLVRIVPAALQRPIAGHRVEKRVIHGIVLLFFAGFGSTILVFAGRSLGLPIAPVYTAAVFLIAGFVTIFLLLFLTRLGIDEGFHPEQFLTRLWLFPALAVFAWRKVAEEDFRPAVASVILLASLLVALIHFISIRQRLRLAQLFAFTLALLSIVSFEIALRHSPYADRLQPLNIGTNFYPNELLFWAPKGLFVRDDQIRPSSDFEVFSINFRSGPASVQKPPGVYRILVLGGSNTWGQWIDDPAKVWPGRLQALLSKRRPEKTFEVLNGGAKAYNLFQLLVLYKTYLKDYELDAIVLYLNINDRASSGQRGLYTYRELFALRNTDKWNEVLDRAGVEDPSRQSRWIAEIQSRLQQIALYNGLSRLVLALRSSHVGRRLEPALLKSVNPVEDYVENVKEFINEAKKKKIHIVFADEFFYFPEGTSYTLDEFSTALRKTTQTEGALFFPAHEILEERFDNDAIVFPWDTVHLNEKGHNALAELIADFFVANGLLD